MINFICHICTLVKIYFYMINFICHICILVKIYFYIYYRILVPIKYNFWLLPCLKDKTLIFTTRSIEVCDQMRAHKKIEVPCLPEEKTWKLFHCLRNMLVKISLIVIQILVS